jgi:hypothetical protein
VATCEQCLEQVDDIFEVARDPSAAYLIRSRLRRAMLSCARLVAESTGTPKPRVLGAFSSAPGTSPDQLEILRSCERIHVIASELCQPSESFDVRWEHGWDELRMELNELRELLRGLSAVGASGSL